MGQAIFWSNVGIDVQTGLGAAITLVSISKAATGVAKYSGAVDPNVGDIILMAAQGMYQVDKRLFRIANVNPAAKTFELENEDTAPTTAWWQAASRSSPSARALPPCKA